MNIDLQFLLSKNPRKIRRILKGHKRNITKKRQMKKLTGIDIIRMEKRKENYEQKPCQFNPFGCMK